MYNRWKRKTERAAILEASQSRKLTKKERMKFRISGPKRKSINKGIVDTPEKTLEYLTRLDTETNSDEGTHRITGWGDDIPNPTAYLCTNGVELVMFSRESGEYVEVAKITNTPEDIRKTIDAIDQVNTAGGAVVET